MKIGAFTFVLHSHLPYYRRAGQWPHGEEVFHEAMAETYVPLVSTLLDLAERGVPWRATLGITPVLAEQISDPLMLRHFDAYLAQEQAAVRDDRARFAREGRRDFAALADFYEEFYTQAGVLLHDRLGGDLLGACRRLQEAGYLQILTSAATHGYLPLFSRDSTVHAQLAVGRATYARHFGRAPTAAWLPECAYRPPYMTRDPARGAYLKPGIESFLAEEGLRLFFSETHAIVGGDPVGKAGGGAVGYAPIPARLVPPIEGYSPPSDRTTFLPYWVRTPEVAVLGRNARTGEQVWSGSIGYPGDPWYREFHRKDPPYGVQYWRVTDNKADLGAKALYDPWAAQGRVHEHARHFAGLVESEARAFYDGAGRPGLIVAAFDTELFGHWWFEGVDWLGEVLGLLAQSEVVDLTTAGEWVAAHPPEAVLDLPESSWGEAGTHTTWLNDDTRWMWAMIHRAERRMEGLVARHPAATGDLGAVLAQAGRELLLVQSSDWEFLQTTGQASSYAEERFTDHLARFQDLALAAERAATGDGLDPAAVARAASYADRDNLFPDLDYRVFAARE
jgi:1,4-alpha-glucan branching enzyme